MNQIVENKSECMVSVMCSTYNQIKYIRTCLDSLVSQKTNFKYEIIVKDDASTDGQQEILKEYYEKYPDKIRLLLLEENHFQQGKGMVAFEKAFNMTHGKYIAICEGDDFWVDNDKLQIQVDFMEQHPDYSLCGHSAYYANEDGSLRKDKFFRLSDTSREVSIEEILTNWTMATNSLLYRKDVRKNVIIPFKGKCINGDYALMVYLALQGKVYYFDKFMSAYRVCSNGSLSQKYIKDIEFFRQTRTEYIKMLERIDDYTSKKYTNILSGYKRNCEFDLYLITADADELKKYQDICATKPLKIKLKYFACIHFNSLYKKIRMIRRKIRLM